MTRIACRYADARAMPWANGGGVTRELVREPPAPAPFGLRLSIARVEGDGPFSLFPGVDRVIALLDGGGFRLRGASGVVEVLPGSAPYAFPGDVPLDCALVAGAVSDFNVMTLRPGRARVERRDGGRVDLGARGFALALADGVRVGAVELGRWDLAEGAGVEALDGPALVVTLE